MQEANSVFTITNLRTQNSETLRIAGVGNPVVKLLRTEFPNTGKDFYKFVLEGFEVDEKFIPLVTSSNYKL